MDLNTAVLIGVVSVLALNQVVMRVGDLYRINPVFYGLWLLDLGVGSLILWFGLPGFEHLLPVSWVVGLMFFVHAAQNLSVRSRRLAADLREREEARLERYAGLAERLDRAGSSGDRSD